MPEFLALDWDSRLLSGIVAQSTRGKVRIRKTFALEWPTEEQLSSLPGAQPSRKSRYRGSDAIQQGDNAHQLGAWLRSELDRLGIKTRDVLVCLPREDAVVRQLEVPDVSEKEMPELVRLQAETKMSSSLHSQLLDFILLPKEKSATTREVLMATIARETSERITEALSAAGLEAKSIGLSSAAMAELVARIQEKQGHDPRENSLVLARNGRRLEISLVRESRLLFTHSAQLTGETEAEDVQLILGEVSRTFVALQRHLADGKLSRAWVIGSRSANRALCEALRKRLDCEVHSLAPVSDLGLSIDPGVSKESPTDDVPELIPEESDVALELDDETKQHGADHYVVDVESDVALALDDESLECDATPFAGPVGMLLAASGAKSGVIDFLNPRTAGKRIDRRKMQIGIGASVTAVLLLIGIIFLVVKNNSMASDLKKKELIRDKLDAEVKRGKPVLAAAAPIEKWLRQDINRLDQLLVLIQAFPESDSKFLTKQIRIKTIQFLPPQGKELARITAKGFAANETVVQEFEAELYKRNFIVTAVPVKKSKDPDYPISFELNLKLNPSGNRKK